MKINGDKIKTLFFDFLNAALKALGVKGWLKIRSWETKIFDLRGRALSLLLIEGPVKGYAILSPHKGTEPIQVVSFSPFPVPEGGKALFMCPGAILLRKGGGFLDLRLRSIFPPQLVPKFRPSRFKRGR